jgi:hypothetical protein
MVHRGQAVQPGEVGPGLARLTHPESAP